MSSTNIVGQFFQYILSSIPSLLSGVGQVIGFFFLVYFVTDFITSLMGSII